MLASVIDVADAGLRSALAAALENAGAPWCTPSAAPGSALAVFRDAASSSSHAGDAALVRLWLRARGRDVENPFVDRVTRHFLGAAPSIDPGHLRTTLAQIQQRCYLRVPQLLAPDAAVHERSLSASSEATALLDDVDTFFSRVRCSRRLLEVMKTALSELVSNALYNAPTGKDGSRLYTSKSRTEQVSCERPVRVQLACDATYVCIAVRDEYGTLSCEDVLDNLYRCYRGSDHQIEGKRGGAGLGLFMMVQGASRIVFNLALGQFTEVIVLRRHTERGTEFAKTAPTINICAQSASLAADKRRYRRHQVLWPALCYSDGQSLPGMVMDISRKGAFIHLRDDKLLPPNHPFELSIVGSGLVPSKGRAWTGWSFETESLPLSTPAVVRWTGPNRRHNCAGLGVEFSQELAMVDTLAAAIP